MDVEWIQLGAVDGSASPGSTSYLENKLGGIPDWPPSHDPQYNTRCELCNLPRPLVFQCYAPFENSPFHRTLYIHACINPQCWNKSESWSCIRIQHKEIKKAESNIFAIENFSSTSNMWCTDANDWDEDDTIKEMTSVPEFRNNFEPVKNINPIDEAMDDISNNLENMRCTNTNSRLLELQKNINCLNEVTAEIEIDDSSNVTIDMPIYPTTDIAKILNEKPDISNIDTNANIQFECLYVKVYPEDLNEDMHDHHIDNLLAKYKQNEKDLDFDNVDNNTKSKHNKGFENEEYEKEKPLHGDILFHYFLTRIKKNPEQIIRYSLGGKPLLISEDINLSSVVKCKKCSANKQFEVQILPTMIPFLQIYGKKETPVEFGNVIIFTCKNSCWESSDKYVKESIIVQCEPN